MGDRFPRRVIESASVSFLAMLFAAHAEHLAKHGIAFSGSDVGLPSWYKRLDAACNDPDVRRPEAFAEDIYRVGRMSCDAGHALIHQVHEELGITRRDPYERLTPCELAIRTYVTERHAFDLAFCRLRADTTRRFVEYVARDPRPIAARTNTDLVEVLRTRIGRFYLRRGHTEFSDVDVRTSERETRFILVHGRAPRLVGVIDDANERRPTRQVEDKQDMVLVDHATGRMSVSVGTPVEEKMLRTLFGEVFYDTADHYREEQIYTGQPLIDHGLASLDCTGIDGLRSVSLTCMRVRAHGFLDMELKSKDLHKLWSIDWGRTMLADAEVTAVHLLVTLDRRGNNRRSIILMPPNRISFDRRVGERTVRTFLERRGFALGKDEGWHLVDAA